MGGETLGETSLLLQHRHHQPTLDASTSPHQDDTAINNNTLSPLSISDHVKNHWNNYVDIVERRPLVTKSITATIILGGADLVAQGLEHARGISTSTIDWPRAGRFACFGLFGAPWSHYYFHWLDYYIPPSDSLRTTLLKVVIDQFIQAPLLLAIMISMLSLMKGEGMQGVVQDMSENFVDALIANCKTSILQCFVL